MPFIAKLYIGVVLSLGAATLTHGLMQPGFSDLAQFLSFTIAAVLAAGLKVQLPSVTGTMSVYFLFILIGIVDLSLPETLVLGTLAVIVQCLWKPKHKPAAIQVLFNASSTVIAVAATYYTFHWHILQSRGLPELVVLGLASIVFFAFNTGPVALVIALTESRPLAQIWRDTYFWSFPYYLIGATIAGLFSIASRTFGWQTLLMLLPLMYLIYRSYREYLGRLEDEKCHAQQMAALHLRTIEALAMAINAKDHSTPHHLQRVQIYSMELAKEFNLTAVEREALQAAALLHDIGKLAVPDHIISKPGRLTVEEFEKMKIHPVVGAEILGRVEFPYPVVPIVVAHHEKWDGTGYPHGLLGEQIPIGARILSAVDCLIAVNADRQDRPALPLDQAMDVVVGESARSFDPRVVEVLKRRYVELDRMASEAVAGGEAKSLARTLIIPHGARPANGDELAVRATVNKVGEPQDFLVSIAAARYESQALFEMAQDLGNSLSLPETLMLMATRLEKLIEYHAVAIYVIREGTLIAEYVAGEDHKLLSSLRMPMGQGFSGWVAENKRAMVNGHSAVEPGYLGDSTRLSSLNSSLAVPLAGMQGETIGVISLYHLSKNAFNRDHLRVLQAVSSKLSVAIENAMKYEQAKSSATTDFLTGLPNARSLFLHLNELLTKCAGTGEKVAVLVCDLDGFKMVNDRFGHLTGNRVLSLFSILSRETSREQDYISRMGGDEFVLVLPGVTEQWLIRKTAELGEIAMSVGRQICGEDVLSISVGGATFPDDGSNAEEILEEADRKMYRNKQERKAGRNLNQLIDAVSSRKQAPVTESRD
jgi:diguanylate cyclase (GGDEF)-like protein/putative nucleotidyltransferase with HDIG domain